MNWKRRNYSLRTPVHQVVDVHGAFVGCHQIAIETDPLSFRHLLDNETPVYSYALEESLHHRRIDAILVITMKWKRLLLCG